VAQLRIAGIALCARAVDSPYLYEEISNLYAVLEAEVRFD
jgi:hypothetical protein